MIDIIPFFAAFVTVLFGIGFVLALNKFKGYKQFFMKKFLQIASNNFDSFFNTIAIRKIEQLLLRIAVISFIVHLSIIFLGNHVDYFQNNTEYTV